MTQFRRMFTPLLIALVLTTFGASTVLAEKANDRNTDNQGNDGNTVTTPVQGTGTGTATLTNNCSPNTGGGKVCTFAVSGQVANSSFGVNAYSGMLTLDYTGYTASNRCAAVTSGNVTFTAPNGDKLNTVVVPGAGSQVCETTNSAVHSVNLVLNVTGGTGVYQGAAGTIKVVNGTTTDTATAGQHTDVLPLSGSLTTQRQPGAGKGNGNGCGNEGHNNGKGNNGHDNGYGNCNGSHDDGNGQGND